MSTPRAAAIAITSTLGVALAALACQTPQDFAPFPCANDGTCPPGLICVAGTCEEAETIAAAPVPGACTDGLTSCGEGCVDTTTDPSNCGGCGTICAGPCCAGACCGYFQTCCGSACCEEGCPANDCDGACFECTPGESPYCGASTGGTCCAASFPYFCDNADAPCWDISVDCATIVSCGTGWKACAAGNYYDCADDTCHPNI